MAREENYLRYGTSWWMVSLSAILKQPILNQRNATGVGFILIRSHLAQVLWCGCWQIRGTFEPLMADEALALESVQKIIPLNLQHVIIARNYEVLFRLSSTNHSLTTYNIITPEK